MSHQSQSAGRGPVISRAGKRKWGYDAQQVDEFLARAHELYESEEPKLTQQDIQNASFDLVKNGYVITQVDAALARLERAVVDKRTSWELARGGRVPFKARSEAMLAALQQHSRRDAGKRFRDGSGKQPSYDRKQVDRLVDLVIAKASGALGVAESRSEAHAVKESKLADVTANRIASAVFTQRKGKRGYDERCVDYYLDAAVQLLSRLESFERVTSYDADAEHESDAEGTPSQSAAFPSSDAVAPLFAGGSAASSSAASGTASSVAAAASRDSFAALNAAEQSIFKPRTASSATPSTASAAASAAAPAPVPVPPAPVQPSAAAAPAHAPVPTALDPEPSSSSLAALAHSVETQHDAQPAQTAQPAPAVSHDAFERHAVVRPAAQSDAAQPAAAQTIQTAQPQSQPAEPAVEPAVKDASTQAFTPWFVTEAAQQADAQPAVPQQAPAQQPQTAAPAASHAGAHAAASSAHESDASAAHDSLFPAAAAATAAHGAHGAHAAAAQTAQPAQSAPVEASQPAESKPAEPQMDEADRYLANLLANTSFPKVDLDIPDLSFTPLSSEDDRTDTPKTDGGQQTH